MLAMLLTASPTQAQQAVVISNDAERVSIADYLEYYEDGSEALTFEDVLAPNFSVNFIPYDRDILHFGITSSAYWLRLNLDWSNVPADTVKILEFGPP